MLLEVKISNHNVFSDVERFVQHFGWKYLDARNKRMEFNYGIRYEKNGVDVTRSFNQNLPQWIVDNSYKVQVLDENDEPIPNPDYEPHYPLIDGLNEIYAEEPDNIEDQFLNMPAFDFFLEVAFFNPDPIRVMELLEKYTRRDDLIKGRFNF